MRKIGLENMSAEMQVRAALTILTSDTDYQVDSLDIRPRQRAVWIVVPDDSPLDIDQAREMFPDVSVTSRPW